MFVCDVSLGIEGDAYSRTTQTLNLNFLAILANSHFIFAKTHNSAETIGTIYQLVFALPCNF